MKPRKYWTATEDAQLTALYPCTPTAKVAVKLGHSLSATYQRAYKLGLAKNAEYLTSPEACRLRRGDNVGAQYRFKKGQTPPNKGLRRPGWAPGRMAETQFRKGERRGVAVRLYKPIGTERMSKDGYLERKVCDALPPAGASRLESARIIARRWRAVHLVVWEAAHGPLPPGHAIAFRNGDRSDIRLDNLEIITRADLMRRNTLHNLPAPLPQTILLLGALNRKINRKIRNEEQDRGSQEPPVRDARGALGREESDGHRAGEGDRGRRARDRGLGESGSGIPHRNGSTGRDGIHRAARGARITASARRSKRTHALLASARVKKRRAAA